MDKNNEFDDVPALDDFKGSLADLRDIVAELINDYGADSNIEFDAGYNNISARIVKHK